MIGTSGLFDQNIPIPFSLNRGIWKLSDPVRFSRNAARPAVRTSPFSKRKMVKYGKYLVILTCGADVELKKQTYMLVYLNSSQQLTSVCCSSETLHQKPICFFSLWSSQIPQKREPAAVSAEKCMEQHFF